MPRWSTRTWVIIAAVVFAAFVVVATLNPRDPKTPPFHCNGTTGVYTAPNGSITLNPYDSECVPRWDQPTPTSSARNGYNGG
jgi:hypothetical protein